MEENKRTSATLSPPDMSDLGSHYKNYADDWEGGRANPSDSDSANEWFYKKQEGEMNHRYALHSAAIQNQYMIDQWNRENAYNDPTEVAKRYRAAGINPRAAFGTGSASGAGLSAHMNPGAVGAGSASGSYGKSDVSQGAENAAAIMSGISDIAGQGVAVAKSIGGLTNTYADTTQKKAVTEGIQIENKYKEQKILTELTNERAEIAKTLKDTELKESERKFYEKRLFQIDQDILESGQRIEESGQRIEESKQNIKESQAQEGKVTEEAKKLKQDNDFYEKYGFYPGQKIEASLVSSLQHLPRVFSNLGSFISSRFNNFVEQGVSISSNVQNKIADVLEEQKHSYEEKKREIKKILENFAKQVF